MKKWIFIAILIAVVILIVRSCKDESYIDSCLEKSKGCQLLGKDAEFIFKEHDNYNGDTLLLNDLPKEYPYLLRTEAEIKNARIYVDVSMGLQPGVSAFQGLLNSLIDYMSTSQLEFYYVRI